MSKGAEVYALTTPSSRSSGHKCKQEQNASDTARRGKSEDVTVIRSGLTENIDPPSSSPPPLYKVSLLRQLLQNTFITEEEEQTFK